KEHIVVDERGAAFFALGMAKETKKPVAIVCTSGTAAANYFPAIVEANYARVPLIVLTADRPHRSEERRVGKEGSSRWWRYQAEDGIRDRNVTGVQTCALPI